MTFDDLRAKYPRLLRPSTHFMCHEGWVRILDRYFEVVDGVMPDGETYDIGQIKEKMGTIRIYDSVYGDAWASVPAVTEAHRLAEARSLHTCEYCGQRGRLRKRRAYLTVTCDDHAFQNDALAIPEEPEPRYHVQTAGGWEVYDPDADAFVESVPPDWL
ncbi:hypothetical protein [Agrobacterium genomosp. 2]|uniref:Uncharacterized protein n=1 Tax=Agrobacterium genomosp. 2 str. CFBP 5494 TaxID=1183436 RepID=A0A9W5F2Q0_9HYPH|nr:hypothetical protein [Agrobacterium genomosp. 2]CUW87569.1 hypothetical protein AGR2A_Cc120102 [Agrobacterium genomosp. 2 str. CFBP 5494]